MSKETVIFIGCRYEMLFQAIKERNKKPQGGRCGDEGTERELSRQARV